MLVHEAEGQHARPTAEVIDSQSVKTTETASLRGYDAGKKIKRRRRHLLMDATGLLVAVRVHESTIQDRADTAPLLNSIRQRWPWLRHVFADGGHADNKLEGAQSKAGR